MNRRRVRFVLGSLAIAAALAVTACTTSGATFPATNVTPAPTPSPSVADVVPTPGLKPTSAPTAAAATPTPAPLVPSISMTTISDSGNTAGCGNWTISFAKPVVSGVSAATAKEINDAITARVTEYITGFKKNMPTEGPPPPGPCQLTGRATVTLNSDGLIGISFNYDEYTGGAHPATIAGSINFVVSSGTEVSMGLLFSKTGGPAQLSTLSRPLLVALLGPRGIDASFIDPGINPLLSNFDTAWAFRKEGLEITFQQYQVAPGSEGTPTIVIPWTSLRGVINPSGPAGPLVD
jgi:hypothetical protein